MSTPTNAPTLRTAATVEPVDVEEESGLSDEERRLRQIERNQSLVAMLDRWREEDLAAGEDNSEVLEEFMRGVDANRIPGSKLFSTYYS